MKLVSHSENETKEIAKKIAKELKNGDVIILSGDLGSGKTKFTEGFLSYYGLENEISSPTFTIVQEYEDGRIPLYHFDVYRIADIGEMDEIGYEDYFFGEGVCIVEWSELIHEVIPDDAIKVTITKDFEKGFDFRKVRIDIPEESVSSDFHNC